MADLLWRNGIWVCKGKAWRRGVDGYFTTLGGRILNPEREVSGLGLDGLQEVVFNGRLWGGAVRGGGKAVEVPNIGEWQCTFCGAAHCWNTRLLEAGCFHAAHCLVDILMSIGSSPQLFPSAPSIVMSTFHCGQSDYQIRSRKRVCGKPVPKLIVAGAGSVFALPKIMMNRHTSVMFSESWFLEMELFFWSVMRPSFDLCESTSPSRKRSAAQ